MAILLNIDTATVQASVAITCGRELVAIKTSDVQKEHASFVHEAIAQLTTENNIALAQLDAVSVTIGPGSYTGLRVGLATAKGLCYALNKPIIAISTLQVMAKAAKTALIKGNDALLCPMIDARRMEVFTAIYSLDFSMVMEEKALIVNNGMFDQWAGSTIYVFGDGSEKLKKTSQADAVIFLDVQHLAFHLGLLAAEAFAQNSFANIAYCQPNYIKAFYTQ